MGHWLWTLSSCNTETISLTLNFLFPPCHSVCDWRDWRYSFLQRDQNSLAMCWTKCHLFQQYKSGLLKSPGCGTTTFNFIVSMFDGARCKTLVGSLMVSTVNGCEFRIPSVSATSVSRESSSRDSPCVERKDGSITWADQICLSQMRPMWLAAGGFLIHLTESPPRLCMKDWIFSLSISLYAFFSSFSHATKMVTLSEYNTFIFPLRAITCLSSYMKESLFKL